MQSYSEHFPLSAGPFWIFRRLLVQSNRVQVRFDRFEHDIKKEMAAATKAHATALQRAQDEAAAAKLNADQVAQREKAILHENERLKRALSNYEARVSCDLLGPWTACHPS